MKSCKRKYSWVFVVVTAAIFFGFTIKSAQAGDPIPGVDVSLEQVPGSIVAKAATGKDGRFNFDKLKPGKYVLRIVPPSFKAEDHNSSRSNLSQSIGPGGVEVYKVSIELRKDKRLKSVKYKAIPILISAKRGGRVTGQITRQSVAIKEEGVN